MYFVMSRIKHFGGKIFMLFSKICCTINFSVSRKSDILTCLSCKKLGKADKSFVTSQMNESRWLALRKVLPRVFLLQLNLFAFRLGFLSTMPSTHAFMRLIYSTIFEAFLLILLLVFEAMWLLKYILF